MTAGLAAMFVGAVVATGLLSRILLVATTWWRTGGTARLVLVNVLSGILACVISAFGHANGGPLDWSYSGIYLLAQAVWLVIDIARRRRSSETKTMR